MALRASDREDSFDADVEGTRYRKDSLDGLDSLVAGQDAGSDEEESRFLPAGAGPNIDGGPGKVTQRYVLLMCVLFLFIGEFSQFIMEPPLQQIMEDFVCHTQYPDHAMGAAQEADSRCKNADVQGTLAMARSWMMWVSMLVRESPWRRLLNAIAYADFVQPCSCRFRTALPPTNTVVARFCF